MIHRNRENVHAHDMTVWEHGTAVDCVVQVEGEFERADPEVGYQGGWGAITIQKIFTLEGRVIDVTRLEDKERQRICDRCEESMNEGRESEAERRQAAAEDRWDAKRHGD